MSFLHGVETIAIDDGPKPIVVVRAGVIGILGTSAYADRNEPILITSKQDAATKLGPAMKEFTLRKHVDKIFQQGNATIIAVNVYNDDDHTATVTNETCTIVGGKFKLALQLAPFYAPVVKSFDLATTYTVDTDYTFDVHGNFTILNSDLLETDETQVKVTYTRHSLSLVPEADAIGGVTDGERTGLSCFELAQTMFGFSPKILLAPVFCETQSFVDELIPLCNKIRARALVDGVMDNITEALASRGPAGTFNFRTGSKRIGLCWPQRDVVFPHGTEIIGLSTFVAGVWSATISDQSKGYWTSPSNKEMLGSGVETVVITGAINDATTEVQLLNAAGIISHLNFGSLAPLTWGNRSAAYPSNTSPDNFLSVDLTADVIDESIEFAMQPFIDRPMTAPIRDSIKETVNAFLNTLVGRGAVLPGAECIYDPAENPTIDLAAGKLTFTNQYLPPLPMERITFKRYLYLESLESLNA